MRIHHYGDLSNLDAPYDTVAIQGLGQPFQNPDDPKYPWRSFSQSTLTLQQDLNEGLTAQGGCLLLEDGNMGPRTCGAMQHFLGAANVPTTCLNHKETEPWIAPTIPCPAPVNKPLPDTGEEEVEAPQNQLKPGGGIPGWAIGLGLGVVAIAVAVALKSKKR